MARRHKDLARAAKLAAKQGWSITNRNGHEFWVTPCGGTRITVSSSPSDRNAARAAMRDLRRAGLVI